MNKIYKVVWSKVKNCYVVVSEIAKNVITGGVKSTKVGKAPLANGLALGAIMAFVITGNVWAASGVISSQVVENTIAGTGTLNVTVSDDQQGLQTGLSDGSVSETVTVKDWESIVLDGSNSVHKNSFNAYENTELIFENIGSIYSADTSDLSKTTVFHAQKGNMDVSISNITLNGVGNAFEAQGDGILTVVAENIEVHATGNAVDARNGSGDGARISLNANNIEISAERNGDTDMAGICTLINANGSISVAATNRLSVTGSNAVNANTGDITLNASELFVTDYNGYGGTTNALRAKAADLIVDADKAVIYGNVLAQDGDGEEAASVSLDLGTNGSLTGKVTTGANSTTTLDLGSGSTWNVTDDSDLTTLKGNNGIVAVALGKAVSVGTDDSSGTIVKAKGLDLAGGARETLANINKDTFNGVITGLNDSAVYATATEDAALYGDVELKEGKVITTMDTDDLVVAGKVTAGKLVSTNGMSIATETGKGKFTVSEVDGNTMMYVYDSEQGKLLYGVNAATGDIMTAGGLSVDGGMTVKGGLSLGGGLSVADGKIDLAENGVVTAAKFKATNGMSIATETGKGKFTVSEVDGNTMMYVYDSEQGKLLYGVNAATGDIMTAGGLDVAGGANVGGSLNVAKGISVANGNIDLAENGVVTAAKYVATNGMKVNTSGEGSFSIGNIAGNTLFYGMSTDSSKTNPTIVMNAQNGNIETQGSLSVGNGAFVSDAASGNAAVKGSLEVGGDAAVTGGLTVGTDVVAGGVSLQDTANRVTAVEDRVSAVEDKNAEQDERIGAVEDRVGDVENRVGAVEDRVGAVEDKNAEQDNRIDAVEDRTGAAENRVGAVEDRVGAIEADNGAQNERIGAVENRVGAAEADNAAQNERIGAVEDKNAEQDERIAATETRIGQEEQTRASEDQRIEQKITDEVGRLDNRLDKVEGRIDKVGAMAAAMASLKTMGYDSEAPTEIAVGIGQYRNETGLAIGAFHYPNKDFMLNFSLSTAGDEVMGGIGATWKIGRKKPEGNTMEERVAKAEAMKEAAKAARVKAQQAKHAKMAAK